MYDEEVVFTDRHIGRLLDALEERGIADDTIVVLTSDHGEGLDAHEDHGHLFHGPTLYDEVIRVPLIVRGPGFTPRRVGSSNCPRYATTRCRGPRAVRYDSTNAQ